MKEERRLVTILFADLSGFTKLSHSLDPEDVHELANCIFEYLNKPIIKHGGTIHKYEGDLVIALFGLHESHEDDPERAIKASLEMMVVMPEINDTLSKKLKTKTDLGLHIGINCGTVVAGEVGSSHKKEYTVMGDIVNLASRLKDTAKRGEIIVSEPVFRQSRYLFEYEALAPVSLKGIEETVKIFKPLKIKEKPDPKRGIQGLYSPLVGRDKEFNILKEKVKELQQGRGGVIFITGEAGLGKSRLYKELKESINAPEHKNIGNVIPAKAGIQITVLEARCLSYGETLTYQPFLQILENILGITDVDSIKLVQERLIKGTEKIFSDEYKEIVPYLGYLFSIRFSDELDEKVKYLPPEALKLQILLSIRRLLLTLAKKQPLILVIEDYHWIDSASLELLEFIFEAPEFYQKLQPPLLLICLSRPEKEKECYRTQERLKNRLGDNFQEIILSPLDERASTRLTYNLLKIPGIPEEFKDKILSKAEGNPFYIEEILRSLIDAGILVFESGIWHLTSNISFVSIPDTVQAVIASRLDRLESDVKNVLQTASVIGRIFYERVLKYVSGIDNLMLSLYLATLEEFEYIQKLESRKLKTEMEYIPKSKISNLKSEIEYVFRHPLIQEVVYNSLLKKRRKELHNRIGECIEKLFAEWLDDFCELLSLQYYSAENWVKAYEYSLRSARKAKSGYLNKQAIEFYDWAIKSLRVQEYVLQNIGVIYANFGDYELALEYYNRSLKISEEIGARLSQGNCLNNIALVCIEQGELQRARECLHKAERITKEIGEREVLRRIMISFGELILAESGGKGVKTAVTYAEKAMKIAEELKSKIGKAEALLLQARIEIRKLMSEGVTEFKSQEWIDIDGKFKEAIRNFEELKQPFDIAKAYYHYGKMLKSETLKQVQGDIVQDKVQRDIQEKRKTGIELDSKDFVRLKSDATTYLQKAKEIFEKIGAKGWLNKISL